MFDRLSDEAKEALRLAWQAAASAKDSALGDLHILIGTCRARGSLAARVLLACGQDPVEVCARAEARAAQVSGHWNAEGERVPFTPLARNVMSLTLEERDKLGHRWTGTHHLLLGILRSDGSASELLARGGLKLLDARKAALQVHEAAKPPAEVAPLAAAEQARVQVLRDAIYVCVELGNLELAHSLHKLIADIEAHR